MSKLFIWGSGGHAKVVLEILHEAGGWQDIVFINDASRESGAEFMGHRVIGGAEHLPALKDEGYCEFVIAVGNNQQRARCFSRALNHGFQAATAIHPRAIVSPSANIGAGSVVMPGAVINASSAIGMNCIINTRATVEHDCSISDHAHLSPGATLGGGVTVGAYTHIGINASILPLATIGDRAVVGAGAVVLKSVESGQIVAGVPAKPIRAFTPPKLSRHECGN